MSKILQEFSSDFDERNDKTRDDSNQLTYDVEMRSDDELIITNRHTQNKILIHHNEKTPYSWDIRINDGNLISRDFVNFGRFYQYVTDHIK